MPSTACGRPGSSGSGSRGRGRRDDLGDRPAAVQRHEDVAERIARGVKRYGQRELRPERGEPADPRHDARGRDGDVTGTEPEPTGVVERIDRGEDAVEVQERLAHPHEHDVREPSAGRGEPPRGMTDLVDDLGGLEVATEAELTRRAERAAHGAAGLARDAERVPLALTATSRVVHE